MSDTTYSFTSVQEDHVEENGLLARWHAISEQQPALRKLLAHGTDHVVISQGEPINKSVAFLVISGVLHETIRMDFEGLAIERVIRIVRPGSIALMQALEPESRNIAKISVRIPNGERTTYALVNRQTIRKYGIATDKWLIEEIAAVQSGLERHRITVRNELKDRVINRLKKYLAEAERQLVDFEVAKRLIETLNGRVRSQNEMICSQAEDIALMQDEIARLRAELARSPTREIVRPRAVSDPVIEIEGDVRTDPPAPVAARKQTMNWGSEPPGNETVLPVLRTPTPPRSATQPGLVRPDPDKEKS